MSKKRLRIFAGPNGSGKSTIFSAVDKKVGCKYFVNADEIYKSLSETGCLSFDYYTILPQEDSLKEAFRTSGFYDKSRSGEDIISRLTAKTMYCMFLVNRSILTLLLLLRISAFQHAEYRPAIHD